MACPGGCVGGGGQPFGCGMEDRAVRAQGLYDEDKGLPKRRSHDNVEVNKIYEEFLKEPNSDIAHKLLHTNYFERSLSDGKAKKKLTHKH